MWWPFHNLRGDLFEIKAQLLVPFFSEQKTIPIKEHNLLFHRNCSEILMFSKELLIFLLK